MWKRTRTRFRPVRVEGVSMLPGLAPGDLLMVGTGARVRPGDVVVAEHAGVLLVKRATFRQAVDGGGEGWWLESDNQKAPGRRDSWDFGAVADTAIVGRVLFRYWPLLRLRHWGEQ
ncbi:S24 family peptidase [Actinocorallia sp. A-T 12471]|uniref:S24 family peptidase n=1 Tax=Actinocorallia sp. A-T 12471 TaxID=3089813 RepID=UPI0029CFD218|nr:S24 family peptidase [Actinocorallia sp. A-T 12471]MDX6738904.1 S24 family peptidase [Actinocorallia sp. A-T 12471]